MSDDDCDEGLVVDGKETGLGAESEECTERNGFLSHHAEWHALTIGVYRGIITYLPWDDDFEGMAEEYEDVANQPWYYKGGYVAGTLLQLVFIVMMLFVWSWFSP